jgi:hypothetical protein
LAVGTAGSAGRSLPRAGQAACASAGSTIGGEKVVARAGETVRMPAGIPHAVRAVEPFKMILTMVRER